MDKDKSKDKCESNCVPEQIVSIATLLAIEMSKGTTIKELQTLKNFAGVFSSVINTLLYERINQCKD